MSINANVERAKEDYDRAYAAGAKSEYDAFWDVFQQNGERKDYEAAFHSMGWTDETFKPKYPIKPVGNKAATNLFRKAKITNLSQILREQGVTLDLSGITGANSEIFSNARSITHIPTVDLSNSTGGNHLFAYCDKLVEIEKLVLTENCEGSQWFPNCDALEKITVEGVIAFGVSLAQSKKLNKAGITSIVNALSTTTSGLTVTFSKTAVDTAFATTDGGTDGSTSAEWLALVATRSNWTIALA